MTRSISFVVTARDEDGPVLDATIDGLLATSEQYFEPFHADVQTWLDAADFREWRRLFQSRRQISDAEFLSRFVPNAPEHLMRPAPIALALPGTIQ